MVCSVRPKKTYLQQMNGLKVITVENGKASSKDMIQKLRDACGPSVDVSNVH